MKKYIAFIVADVVLLLYTCYITYSHTTQEKKVTSEEREIVTAVLNDAIKVANKHGPQIIVETDGSIPVSTMAAALILAGFCVNGQVSMYDAVNMLMSAYKQAKEDSEERS